MNPLGATPTLISDAVTRGNSFVIIQFGLFQGSLSQIVTRFWSAKSLALYSGKSSYRLVSGTYFQAVTKKESLASYQEIID